MQFLNNVFGTPEKPKPLCMSVRINNMFHNLPSDIEIENTLLEFKESPLYKKEVHDEPIRKLFELTKPPRYDDPYVSPVRLWEDKKYQLGKLRDTLIM